MYDAAYYAARCQDRDRPALLFYQRLARRWFQRGPVLDFGCGAGFLLKRLARYFDVSGYEISPYAREIVSGMLPDITVYSVLEEIPDNSLGGIVSIHTLEHIPHDELPEVFSHWRRILAEKGRVICVVPDAEGKGRLLKGENWIGFGDPTHVSLFGWSTWLRLFTENGFRVDRVGTDGLWNLPYRNGYGRQRDGVKFALPTVVQFLAGRLILKAGAGESAIFLMEKVNGMPT